MTPKTNQHFKNDHTAKWLPPSPSQLENDQPPVKNVSGNALVKKNTVEWNLLL